MKNKKLGTTTGLNDGKISAADLRVAWDEGVRETASTIAHYAGVSNEEYYEDSGKWEFGVKAGAFLAVFGAAYGITKLVVD